MVKKNEMGTSGPGARLGLPVLAVAAVSISAFATAAEEDLYFSSLPVVATVSRLPQALADAPGAVTVIDRDMIRQSGVRRVSDLLRLVPGFFVTPHNQDAPRVVYHGLSNENNSPRVQVLVDGRPQYSPLFQSGVNWNLLPVVLEDIERIEVIRGSNSAAYGSNAFMGVINIVTQDASQANGWMFAANHGNQNIRDETIRWGGKVGQADVRFSYQQQGDEGLHNMQDGKYWFDPHDSRKARLFDLRADLSLTDRDELRFSLSQASDISQYGRPDPKNGLAEKLNDRFRDFSQSSTALNLAWRRVMSADEEVKLSFFHVQDWGSSHFVNLKDLPGGGTYPVVDRDGGESSTNMLELQHSFAPGAKTRFVWGLGVNDATLRSRRQFFSDGPKYRLVYRSFGNLEWRPENAWVLNFGASLEQDSTAGTLFDPRASVSYHLHPEHTVRFVAARAHRTPSLYEARGDTRFVGVNQPYTARDYLATDGLRAERMDTLELGYLADLRSRRASLDVRAFYERLPNRIQIIPTALVPPTCENGDSKLESRWPCGRADSAVNGERVGVHGYEYQWRWQPFETTRLMYSHAYIRIDATPQYLSYVADDVENTEKLFRHTRESAPRHSSSAMVMQSLPYGLEASVMYYKMGFMRWTKNSYVHPLERIDWRLAYPFSWGTKRAEVAYTAQSSNGSNDGLRNTRIVNETHWLSLRLEM